MDPVSTILAHYAEQCGNPDLKKATCIQLIQTRRYGLDYTPTGNVCCICGGKTKWSMKVRGWTFPVCEGSYHRIIEESPASVSSQNSD